MRANPNTQKENFLEGESLILLRGDMKIESKEHLITLYDIVRNSWQLFQQDFEGDPDLEFSSDYEDLTLLHDHLDSLVNLDPTIVYPYEINFHEKIMRILENENECALKKLRNKNALDNLVDDIDQRILGAKKILRKGQTKPNLSAALDLIMERQKGTKHTKKDWHGIADDYGVLTEDRELWEAMKELVKRHKFPSEQALIIGLKRFKEKTSYPVFIEALKTLPWLDEPDE